MNCHDCREMLVDWAEGVVEQAPRGQIDAHLKTCPACSGEAEQITMLRNRLLADGGRKQAILAIDAVMERVIRDRKLKLRRSTMWKRIMRTGVGLSAAAALLVAVLVLWGVPARTANAAEEVLADGAKATANLQTVHIKARMRTAPADNFEYINPDLDFVPIDIWKRFSQPPQWRFEKPARVVVMDGHTQVLWIKPVNVAAKGPPGAGFIEWLRPLMNVDKVLESEIKLAQAQGSKLTQKEEISPEGNKELIVTVDAKAQGDLTNDWCRNKSIQTSDNRRVYRFDAQTKRLAGLQVFIHVGDKEVLVFEVTQIDYDQPLDQSLFALELPKDIHWAVSQPPKLPDNEKYSRMTAKDAAQAFFQACADENWDEVGKFCDMPVDMLKNYLGGLKIISIGEPFKSGMYGGQFVPYEIKLKSGDVKKFNLAIRNDNPAKRWMVDGGF